MKKRTPITREHQELNNAIKTVLLSDYKKDNPKVFDMVKKAGYEYYKNGNGDWVVCNPETKKEVWISKSKSVGRHKGYCYKTETKVYHGYYANMNSYNLNKFDYVSCLAKPFNRTYYDMMYQESKRSEGNRAWDSNFHKLSWAKEQIIDCRKQVEKMKVQLKVAETNMADKIAALDKLRTELGLKRKERC